MKKLLLLTLALAIIPQAYGFFKTIDKTAQEIEQQEQASKLGQEEGILQSLKKAPVFLKLKTKLSEQFPGLFDTLASGDTGELLKILGSKLQNVISSSFQNLTPAIQDIKPATITIADLRKLKSALDAYANNLRGGEEVSPQLRDVFESAKNAYKELVQSEKTFSNVVSKDFPIRHHSQEFLQGLMYNIIEGNTAAEETPAYPKVKTLPKVDGSQATVLDSLGKFLGF